MDNSVIGGIIPCCCILRNKNLIPLESIQEFILMEEFGLRTRKESMIKDIALYSLSKLIEKALLLLDRADRLLEEKEQLLLE